MAVMIQEFDVCTSYGEWDRLHRLTGSRNARESVHGEVRIWHRWEVRTKNGSPLSGKIIGISLGLVVARFFQFGEGHLKRCVMFFEYTIRISCLILK